MSATPQRGTTRDEQDPNNPELESERQLDPLSIKRSDAAENDVDPSRP